MLSKTMEQNEICKTFPGSTHDDLECILQLARVARDASNSLAWKTDIDGAFEVHGDACDALWAELNRQLDNRAATDNPVMNPAPLPDVRKEVRKQVLAALKAELPDMVSAIIDSL